MGLALFRSSRGSQTNPLVVTDEQLSLIMHSIFKPSQWVVLHCFQPQYQHPHHHSYHHHHHPHPHPHYFNHMVSVTSGLFLFLFCYCDKHCDQRLISERKNLLQFIGLLSLPALHKGSFLSQIINNVLLPTQCPICKDD